jgi:hypothetical protein
MIPAQDLHEALANALLGVSSRLGSLRLEHREPGLVCVCDGPLEICLRGVPHLNEIQCSISVANALGGREFFAADTVQAWLGEPAKAYMFHRENIESVCYLVAQFVQRVISKYRSNPDSLTDSLVQIENNLVDLSNINQKRKDAAEAWNRKDFESAKRLYSDIFDHLTPVERKRFEIARRTVAR